MAPPTNFRRGRLAVKICLSVALLFAALAALFVFGIGRWLVVEDPLEKSQAIVVLSGRLPLRAIAAAEIHRAGWAPQVWLTRSDEPGRTLAALNIPFSGEDFYNTQILVHSGVPPQAICVLPDSIINTADELREVAAAMPAGNSGSVIIVTSKAHTRRVRVLWHKLGHGRAIVRAAENDPFDPRHWWATSGDALDVMRECLGLLNAWAGLPLHGG
jgi:uncharacterized SAM-binding protein YcdF (DUF218 family)